MTNSQGATSARDTPSSLRQGEYIRPVAPRVDKLNAGNIDPLMCSWFAEGASSGVDSPRRGPEGIAVGEGDEPPRCVGTRGRVRGSVRTVKAAAAREAGAAVRPAGGQLRARAGEELEGVGRAAGEVGHHHPAGAAVEGRLPGCGGAR